MSEVPYVYVLSGMKYWTPFEAVYSSYFYINLTGGGILGQDHRQLLLRMYKKSDWAEEFSRKRHGDFHGR